MFFLPLAVGGLAALLPLPLINFLLLLPTPILITLAQRLATGPSFAYSTTKALLTRELDSDLSSSIEMDALTQALLMHSHDWHEFYNAWSEGRKPAWTGR